MALTKSTYSQAASLTYEDVTISPATLADGTLAVRFDPAAFPQKSVKYAGRRGSTVAAPVLTLGVVTTTGGTFAAATYFWKITAVDAGGGESPVSNEITNAIAINGTIAMSWAALTNAAAYKVYRGTATGAENKLVATLGLVTSYIDTGTAGTTATLPTADTTGRAVPRAARTTHGAGS
jgi:hypothetical protein